VLPALQGEPPNKQIAAPGAVGQSESKPARVTDDHRKFRRKRDRSYVIHDPGEPIREQNCCCRADSLSYARKF